MAIFSFFTRNYNVRYPPTPPKEADALRFGILGAAAIGPKALITPAKSHPGVIIAGVASRDVKKAERYAKTHGILRVFGSYQELIDDPSIDAIYNPLPNGLHYEWTVKCLLAGKHVLLEKPSCSNAEETKRLFELASRRNLVLLEAFHPLFHPAVQKIRDLAVTDKTIGELKSVEVDMTLPDFFFNKDDIRYLYHLAGGAMMDMGCYTTMLTRTILGEPTSVQSANPIPTAADVKVDSAMTTRLSFPNDANASLSVNLSEPNWGPFKLIPSMPRVDLKIVGTEGEIDVMNFAAPYILHSITLSQKGKGKRVLKVYEFEKIGGKKVVANAEDWWTTYRYQLEAFVDRIKGREPQTWITPENSILNMETIDAVYKMSGLGRRATSEFFGKEGF